jgi:hypothetical protein
MSLVGKSTLVTAPNGTAISKYELRVSNKVEENMVIVDDRADELKQKIETCYKNLNTYFLRIAEEYRRCANQSVKGDRLVSSLKKVATNCENQGRYCLNRKKQLDTLYKKALSEAYTNDLNEAIDANTSENYIDWSDGDVIN